MSETLTDEVSDKEEDFDGFEFIVELVEDDEEEEEEEEEDRIEASPPAESSDSSGNKREFFKYVDGFLSRSQNNKEEEERKRKEELIERKGLFKCSICGKFFLYRSKIHHHLVHDHGVDKGNRLNSWVIDEAEAKAKPLIPCHICGKTYQMKDSLARHVKVKHTDFEKIKCPLCPTEFTQKSDVERHIKRKHSEHVDRGSDEDDDYRGISIMGGAGTSSVPFTLPDLQVPQAFGRRSRMVEEALKSRAITTQFNPELSKDRDESPSSSKINNLTSDFNGGTKDKVVVKTENADVKVEAAGVVVKTESTVAESSAWEGHSSIDFIGRTIPSSAREIPEYVGENDAEANGGVRIKTEPWHSSSESPSESETDIATRPNASLTGKNLPQKRKTIQEQMRDEMNSETPEIMKCSICTNLFDNRALFIHHLIKKHGIDKIQAATKSEDWMDHQTSHKCKSCNFSCKIKEELIRHIAIRHKIIYKWAWEKNRDVTECSADHSCHLCGKCYMEEADLHAHMERFCHASGYVKRRKLDE